MEVVFQNKSILELYQSGKSRKYKVSEEVLKKFSMRIQQIEAAHSIHDLWKTPSLNFEHLNGSNRHSVRITGRWRLEMEITWDNQECTTGTVIITELSNHYGD